VFAALNIEMEDLKKGLTILEKAVAVVSAKVEKEANSKKVKA